MLCVACFVACAMAPRPPGSSPPRGEDPPVAQDALRAELEKLRQRVDQLERRPSDALTEAVDLSGRDVSLPGASRDLNPIARPWYENIDLWGFGAFAYLDTGGTGVHPQGGFLIKEASIFLEAHAWEHASLFFELQTNRLGQDAGKYVRTGEINVHFRNLWADASGDHVSLKAGRIDVPFGEEYLSQDATDNPLTSNSAAYAYGFDEGLLLYGRWSGVGWIAAVTDGTDRRSVEDDPAKALNLKLYGKPIERLYLSASLMRNGDSAESALEFAGSHVVPVGADGAASTAGASPSETVDSTLYELDARCALSADASVALSFGQARVDDPAAGFDRDITWFAVQPRLDFARGWYAVLRYSEIGTYDSDAGYHFDGKTIADGNAAFGFDVRRFRRLSAGLGWRANPRVLLKAEVGRDEFELIDGSPFDADNDEREFVSVELVMSF